MWNNIENPIDIRDPPVPSNSLRICSSTWGRWTHSMHSPYRSVWLTNDVRFRISIRLFSANFHEYSRGNFRNFPIYIYKLYIRFENCENSRSFGKYQIANLWISCIYKFVDTYAEFHNFLHILQILYIYICRSDWKILVDGCTSYVHYVLLLSIIYEIFNFTERGNWFWIEITADGENRSFIGEI